MACPGLPTKEVAVDIVCSATHLNATLRMIGNAVQSDLHCASTRLPNAATKACGDTQGESSKVRRHLWSGKNPGPSTCGVSRKVEPVKSICCEIA